MEIRLLRYFLAVAREENITKASESLHISQPSLSKQLMELEQEVGKQLLVRGKRKTTLTEDGVLLKNRAIEIISLVEKTERELTNDSSQISGEVAIGGFPTAQVLNTAAQVRSNYPEIRFDFYINDATSVLERLEHGSLDFAVLLEPIDTTKYEYFSLDDSTNWGLLLPASCKLAKKDSVERKDLGNIPLIMHHRIGLQQEISHWAQTKIEELDVAATYNVLNGNPETFVQSGLGYLLTTDDHIPKQLSPELCFRPLFPTLEIRHAIVWKRYATFSKAAEAFLQEMKNSKPVSRDTSFQ